MRLEGNSKAWVTKMGSDILFFIFLLMYIFSQTLKRKKGKGKKEKKEKKDIDEIEIIIMGGYIYLLCASLTHS